MPYTYLRARVDRAEQRVAQAHRHAAPERHGALETHHLERARASAVRARAPTAAAAAARARVPLDRHADDAAPVDLGDHVVGKELVGRRAPRREVDHRIVLVDLDVGRLARVLELLELDIDLAKVGELAAEEHAVPAYMPMHVPCT
jgi:hypothetical protein